MKARIQKIYIRAILIALVYGCLGLPNLLSQENSIARGTRIIQSNPDSAILIFKKVKEVSILPKDARNYLRANIYHAYALQNLGNFSESSRILFEGLTFLNYQDKDKNEDLVGLHLYTIGTNFISQGNANNAIKYLEESTAYFIRLIKDPSYQYKDYAEKNLNNSYLVLGQGNKSIGNFEKSQYYYDLYLSGSTNITDSERARIFNDYGNLFSVQDNFSEALILYKRGLESSENSTDKNDHVLLLNNAAYSFIKREELDSATYYINLAKEAIDKLKSNSDLRVDKEWESVNLKLRGYLSLKKLKPTQADSFFQRALTLVPSENYSPKARITGTQAQGLIETGYFKEGIPLFLQAIETLIPEGTLYQDELYADPFFLKAFSYLITAEKGLYAETKDPKHLREALKYAHFSTVVEDSLRTSLDYESSKMFLISESHDRAEEAIDIALELYETTQEEYYLEEAFLFSERNHALLLLENINQLEALAAAQIPDSLRFEENRLKTNLIFARKILKEKQLGLLNDEQLSIYKTAVFDAQESYNRLTKQLRQGSLIYDALSRNLSISTLDDIQRQLTGTDQGIIQYFVGKEHTFGFLITEDGVQLKKLAVDFSVEEAVLAFRDGILAAGRDPKLDVLYIQNAQKLYHGLVTPFENGPLPKRLVVIPDGVLGYVPFDALLTGKPDDNFNYSLFPYLMRKYQISYAYSGTLWKKMLKAPEYQRPTEQYLAIAPVFKESEQYAYLQFSEKEVEYIADRLNAGRNLLYQEASKSSFLDILETRLYRILHFSTHAEMNDEVPMDSHIVMYDEEQDHKLSLADLYAMRLNADMVVLAACETAGGKLQHGEGIISMARGFAYAGCRSLLASLWKVNHFSTSQIMQNYYESLYYGASKDDALQHARLEFLNRYKGINGHPFYWAAFTPIGNMEPILKHPFWRYIGYLSGGGLVLLFLLFRLRKRRA
ncbi:MAG: CHAT domain-containing protein [Bacteroidota bacterium]